MCSFTVKSLVFGGDNIPGDAPDDAANDAFKAKIGEAYAKAATEAKEDWVDEVELSA